MRRRLVKVERTLLLRWAGEEEARKVGCWVPSRGGVSVWRLVCVCRTSGMSSGDWARRVGRDKRYLLLPILADVLESLLQGIDFFIKIFVHVGFEHPIPVVYGAQFMV